MRRLVEVCGLEFEFYGEASRHSFMPVRKRTRYQSPMETLRRCDDIERTTSFLRRHSQEGISGRRSSRQSTPAGRIENPEIESLDGDDEQFLHIVRCVLEQSLEFHRPSALRVLRVDNWFGPRWLGFAGKVLGALGVHAGRLVIPPFVPSRIVSEIPWRHTGEVWRRESEYEPLHKRMRSADNLGRFFDLFCPETMAMWFSSRSAANGRGAVMVYSSAGDPQTASWYAELAKSKANDWSPKAMKRITPGEFSALAADALSPNEPLQRNDVATEADAPHAVLRQ
jgi:hypothetical protein